MLGPVATVVLIFGGCCSNVFALEAIVKSHPDSGLLITLFQFVFTCLAAYPTQFSIDGPYNLRKPTVPLRKWMYIALMFFSINMMNNWAFAFNISVPVHIILRSFGGVTTMIAGWLRGKRYSQMQVISVMILTVGVVISAWADSSAKGKSMSFGNQMSTSDFTAGLTLLLLAQIFAAYQGTYVEDTYAQHGSSWRESLFYCHLLSLPMFLPLATKLKHSYARLSSTAPLDMAYLRANSFLGPTGGLNQSWLLQTLFDRLEQFPRGILFLVVNSLTQLACISGVNLLSAKSSAVTVTIVLNIRKLVSFILSTILFGHELSGLMVLGSALVFGSGALYGWETSWRLPREREKKTRAKGMNGSSKKEL